MARGTLTKLVILSPPFPLTEDQRETVRRKLADWTRLGGNVSALVLDPGWTREVIEGDAVFVRLSEIKAAEGGKEKHMGAREDNVKRAQQAASQATKNAITRATERSAKVQSTAKAAAAKALRKR